MLKKIVFQRLNVIGSIPIEPKLAAAAESGTGFADSFADSEAAARFSAIFQGILVEKMEI